jgi:hypothetical protein
MPTYSFTQLPIARHRAANQAQFACVRLHRCASDPDNPERLSLSGKLSEVCLALEQLAARQNQIRRA